MHNKKRWLVPVIILVLVIAAVLGYAGYYFYAFTQLQITDIGVTKLTDLSLKGFSFSGYLDISNPNFISVSIKRVEYGIVFEPTSQLLSSGMLEGRKLAPKQATRIPFHENISWAPALSLVIQLGTSKEPVNIIFSGNVYMTEKIKIPFIYKIDVREYLVQYVESQKQETVDKAVQTVEEKYGKIAGTIAERVAGFFT